MVAYSRKASQKGESKSQPTPLKGQFRMSHCPFTSSDHGLRVPVSDMQPTRIPAPDIPAPPAKSGFSLLHPVSGLIILGVDTAFFGVDAASLGLTLPISCATAFLITSVSLYHVQRRMGGDRPAPAAVKALIGGLLAGIPTSISGTLLGTLVLLLSGLSAWNQRNQRPQ